MRSTFWNEKGEQKSQGTFNDQLNNGVKSRGTMNIKVLQDFIIFIMSSIFDNLVFSIAIRGKT